MLERSILIVDDNKRIEDIYIPSYRSEIEQLAKGTKWEDYSFSFIHKQSMKEAIDYLSDVNNCVDVLVVDYDFGVEKTFEDGAAFVSFVRGNINRFCQIVFYTMHGINNIEKSDLIDLVNSDVYKLVDKASDSNSLSSIIFEAATRRNPIVESLERFYIDHSAMLKTYKYTIFESEVTFEEIINHIRMDDSDGRLFVEKLLNKAVVQSIDVRR